MSVRKVNYFFNLLKRVYGPTYRHQYGLESDERMAKQEWFDAIKTLDKTSIDAGFQRLKQQMVSAPDRWEWPNVARTIALCKPTPADLGLPEVDLAWHEACQHAHEPLEHLWSHRAVYLAGHFSNWFDIRNATSEQDRSKIARKYHKEYQRLVERIATTGKLEDQPLLEDENARLKPFELSARYHAQRHQEAMRAMGIDPNSGRTKSRARLQALGFLKERGDA